MRRRLVPIVGSVLLALAAPAPAVPAVEGTDVRFGTEDGLQLAATYWEVGDEGGPAVVLLPMYGGARTSWRALVPALLDRGLSVLAVDPRGHGESATQPSPGGGTIDLAARVKARDTALFAETWRDVAGALRWLVEERKRGSSRIGLVGASVGASVALDAARRLAGSVRAVLALTPGPKYLGLDSVAHVAEIPADVPVAVLTHRAELEGVAEPVWAALTATRKEAPNAPSLLRVLDVPPPPGVAPSKTLFHGLRMLGTVPLLEDWIADWLAGRLSADPEAAAATPLLDGEVAEEMDAERGGAWARAPRVFAPEGVAARAALGGVSRVAFAATLPERAAGLQVLVHARRGDPRTEGGHAWGNLDATFALPGGEMTAGTTDASAAEGWPEPPVVALAGKAEGGTRPLEGLVRLPPLPAEGLVQVWMAVGFVDGKGALALPPGVRREDPSTWTEITRP